VDALKTKVFETYKKGGDLGSLLLRLLAAQKNDWSDLRENYNRLGEGQTRVLTGPGADRILLQFNPARAGSTLAKIDARSLQKRECFLCIKNLPREQKGILYEGDYLALCNPYPIFDKHFTIASVVHKPQDVAGPLADFLSLAADVGPEFTVFYNGPQCGASAPDHLHFQACPAGRLPIENELDPNGPPLLQSGDWAVHVSESAGRGMIMITAKDLGPAIVATRMVLTALRQAVSPTVEPLVNIIARRSQGIFKTVVFPRRKFRPDCFYMEGEQRIVVSPAAVELGGLIITPFKKDFELLDFAGAVTILKEVSLDRSSIIKLLKVVPDDPRTA
jgi:hypothetical protein